MRGPLVSRDGVDTSSDRFFLFRLGDIIQGHKGRVCVDNARRAGAVTVLGDVVRHGPAPRAVPARRHPWSVRALRFQNPHRFTRCWMWRFDVPDQPAAARLMTLDDIVEYLGLSQRWLYEQARTGALPSMLIARTCRFRLADVDAFVDGFRVNPDEGA
jgi:predicted DNA-binding transcriptional regulator AlpA